MTRSQGMLAGGLLAVVAVSGMAAIVHLAAHHAEPEEFHRITIGMSGEDAAELFKDPPYVTMAWQSVKGADQPWSRVWRWDVSAGTVMATVDGDDIVRDRGFTPRQESLIARIRRWVGL